MSLKHFYQSSFFAVLFTPLVFAGQRHQAFISPMKVVAAPSDSVSFSCSLPTDDTLEINWFIDDELFDDRSDNEDIMTSRDSNGLGSIKFTNLEKHPGADVYCRIKSRSGSIFYSSTATYTTVGMPTHKHSRVHKRSAGSSSGRSFEPAPEYGMLMNNNTNATTPTIGSMSMSASNSTMPTGNTTATAATATMPTNNGNRPYFSQAVTIIMTAAFMYSFK